MKVKLITDIEIIVLKLKLPKGTIFDVTEVKKPWYICQNEEVNGIYIPKEFCEVVE